MKKSSFNNAFLAIFILFCVLPVPSYSAEKIDELAEIDANQLEKRDVQSVLDLAKRAAGPKANPKPSPVISPKSIGSLLGKRDVQSVLDLAKREAGPKANPKPSPVISPKSIGSLLGKRDVHQTAIEHEKRDVQSVLELAKRAAGPKPKPNPGLSAGAIASLAGKR